jgi:hypothetical protein
MRAIAVCAALAAASTGCLSHTAFQCARDGECGTGGVCERIGYCSVPDPACAGTGRSFSDSAGGGLSNTCVPGEEPGRGPDAGVDVDAAMDGPVMAGCPAGYAPIGGSTHAYKALSNVSWDEAANQCRAAGAAYLAVPDDAAELASLAALVTAPFWIGIDDKRTRGMFVTQKGAPATLLPWAQDQPDQDPPAKECVEAISSTQIATERCGTTRPAVCECEP